MIDESKYLNYINHTSFIPEARTYISFDGNIEAFSNFVFSPSSFARGYSDLNCFDPYWSQIRLYNKKDLRVFICHPSYPLWYKNLINEINSFFNNIKVEIVEERDINIYEPLNKNNLNRYYTDSFRTSLSLSQLEKTSLKAKQSILEIKVKNNLYVYEIRKLTYIIHHIFRMISFNEKYFLTLLDEDPLKNYLEFVLELNNRALDIYSKYPFNSSYKVLVRALSERRVELKNLENLNNREYTKSFSRGIQKQTSILNQS